jgi:hypothetical protein
MLRRAVANTIKSARAESKRFFGAHGHGPAPKPGRVELHAPVIETYIGNGLQVVMWFWIFYCAKENKGQIFGLYQPWLHPHEHHAVKVKYTTDEQGRVEFHDNEDDDHHGHH